MPEPYPRENPEKHLVGLQNLPPIKKQKNALRYKHLALRDQIRGVDGLAFSRIVRDEVRAWEIFKKTQCISTYISMRSEVSNHAGILCALEAGKIACVPKVFGTEIRFFQINNLTDDLAPGTFGVLEPREHCKEISPDVPELHIIPGVVFDTHGNRIGYGKGYYDRFLRRISPNSITIGLAFDSQITEKIEVEPEDIPLHYLATPRRGIFKCA